jgi:hypothetical protein
MLEQKRFVSAATHLNDALQASFSVDLVAVSLECVLSHSDELKILARAQVKACHVMRDDLVLRKHSVLEEIVKELRGFVFLQPLRRY